MMSPVPQDLPISIPGSIPFFTVLLVVGFVLHIVFVLLTVSGAVMSVVTEAVGHAKKDGRYLELAQRVLTATSVNKSLAVVLGVAPLLLVGVLYTRFFYPPTVILGGTWLSVIWLLILGFLLLYAYKFSWERLQARPGVHLLLGVLGTIPFLVVPMIFVVVMGLMRRPDLWMQTHSFVQAMFYPTVWPRYLHFMAATAVFGGLLPIWIAWRQERKASREKGGVTRTSPEASVAGSETAAAAEAQTGGGLEGALDSRWATGYGLRWTGVALLIEVVLGLVVLFTMPGSVRGHFLGGSAFSTLGFAVGAVAVAAALGVVYVARRHLDPGRALRNLGIALFVVVLAMATVRLQIRDVEIAPYTAASEPSAPTASR